MDGKILFEDTLKPFLPRAKKILEWARAEARSRTDTRILPLDILICAVREEDGYSAAVLETSQIDRVGLLDELARQRDHDLAIERGKRKSMCRRDLLVTSKLPPSSFVSHPRS